MSLSPELSKQIDTVVERERDALAKLAKDIHQNPELPFEEHKAAGWIASLLEARGFSVERGLAGMKTALRASKGNGKGPKVAILGEYDALPGIGHACGHNIIGTAGLGAGIAAAMLAEEVGGRVVILGTPAEEGGGGKIALARAGAFEEVDAALMVHPSGYDLTRMDVIAVQELTAVYTGEAAHAAAFPHRGRNALDAAVLGYLNVAALRQHIRPTERVHGIITAGGDKPNIVPAHAETQWMVRSGSIRTLEPLKGRVAACLEAGAAAAGCEVDLRWKPVVYADMLDNEVLVDRYKANSAALGRPLADPDPKLAVVGSTDMGNISHLVPSIHPVLAVSPPDVSIHSAAFAGHAGGPAGDAAAPDGARAMAATVVDLWADPSLVAAARTAFDDRAAA